MFRHTSARGGICGVVFQFDRGNSGLANRISPARRICNMGIFFTYGCEVKNAFSDSILQKVRLYVKMNARGTQLRIGAMNFAPLISRWVRNARESSPVVLEMRRVAVTL